MVIGDQESPTMCVPTRLLVSLAVVCSVSLMSGAAAVSAQEMTSTEKDLMKLFGFYSKLSSMY